jgi:alkylhydroperoxidase family enzyme
LKKAQIDPPVVDALRDGTPITDTRLAAVAAFTRAVIATRGAVADDALEAFLAAGFTDANTLEVVLGVSLATLCNFANNLARNELNPELAAYRWEPQTQAA